MAFGLSRPTPAPVAEDYLALAKRLEAVRDRIEASMAEAKPFTSDRDAMWKLKYQHTQAADALRAIYGLLS